MSLSARAACRAALHSGAIPGTTDAQLLAGVSPTLTHAVWLHITTIHFSWPLGGHRRKLRATQSHSAASSNALQSRMRRQRRCHSHPAPLRCR
eukprot:4019681-Pleurochrysis_carterae.AAC.1